MAIYVHSSIYNQISSFDCRFLYKYISGFGWFFSVCSKGYGWEFVFIGPSLLRTFFTRLAERPILFKNFNFCKLPFLGFLQWISGSGIYCIKMCCFKEMYLRELPFVLGVGNLRTCFCNRGWLSHNDGLIASRNVTLRHLLP